MPVIHCLPKQAFLGGILLASQQDLKAPFPPGLLAHYETCVKVAMALIYWLVQFRVRLTLAAPFTSEYVPVQQSAVKDVPLMIEFPSTTQHPDARTVGTLARRAMKTGERIGRCMFI